MHRKVNTLIKSELKTRVQMQTIKGVVQLGIKTSLDNLTRGSKPWIWYDGSNEHMD